MLKIADELFITVLKVIKKNGQTLFDCEGNFFPKINAVAFEGCGKLGPSNVPIMLFRGQPLETVAQRWFFMEYGTHAASIAVFQYNFHKRRDIFKGWYLETQWFIPGDILVIVGHSRELSNKTIQSLLKLNRE